ncbi:hypothetical protein K440DRAFT_30705 [Wilcoxina mikolae CBS 423.85]|nr:hypothetical protein K440DRAFT_30705 [Wilcoxina mikolae CBS 423.85]
MADVVSLLSAIVQLVDFGAKVSARLNEFSSSAHDVPGTFKSIQAQLPLLLNILSRLKVDIDSGKMDDDRQRALSPVVDDFADQVRALKAILDTTLPPSDASTWERRQMVIMSLWQDKKVKDVEEKLERIKTTLTLDFVACPPTVGNSEVEIARINQRLSMLMSEIRAGNR